MKNPLRTSVVLAPALIFALILVSMGTAVPAAAKKGKSGSTAPGKYTDWKDEIDELEIVETFKLSDYSEVVVEPFDTEGVELPDKSDNTYSPVKAVLADPAGPFTQGLAGELPDKLSATRGTNGGAGSLVIRAKVLSMDPGSQAARYWAGFGAGAARGQISGEVVDGASGKVLLRFTQERRSGVGVLGGNYVELMNRNLVAIGEDVALILNSF